MTYQEIIRQMESSGHYSEARELEDSVRSGSCSEYNRVRYREDACDGMPRHTYASDCAERAFEDIRSRERYEEVRPEEAEQERRDQEHQAHLAHERQQEQEYYEQQQQQEAEQQEAIP